MARKSVTIARGEACCRRSDVEEAEAAAWTRALLPWSRIRGHVDFGCSASAVAEANDEHRKCRQSTEGGKVSVDSCGGAL